MSTRKSLQSAVVAALLVFSSQSAFAQACIGSPMDRGQKQIGAGLGFSDAGTAIDVNGALRLNSPITLGASVQMVDFDYLNDNAVGFGVHGAYELSAMTTMSGCITAGFNFLSAEQDLGVGFTDVGWTSITIPVGFSVGKRMEMSNGMYWIPNGGAALVITKVSFDDDIPGDLDDTSTDFGFNFGATLGKNNWFVRAGIGISTAEGSDTMFGIGAGLLLGGR